tara:strand:- start:235 stop:1047 length:813 start_codon:yes stop_codon:yes gene_type:complete
MTIYKIIWAKVMKELKDEISLHRAYHDLKLLEPKTRKNEDILLFNLMKISDLFDHKVKHFKYNYERLKKYIFLQFDRIPVIGIYDSMFEDSNMFEDDSNNRWVVIDKYEDEIPITHPNQSLDSNTIRTCPCSKPHIFYHCVVKHSYNDSTCWVGNSCIKKFLPHLKKQLAPLYKKATKLRNKHISLCKFCKSEIEYGKNFCNHFCNMSFYTGFVYGKYKGEMIVDVAKKDFSYIKKLNNCESRLLEKKFGLCLHNEFDWNFIKIIQKLNE